jgi:hypothetical protein
MKIFKIRNFQSLTMLAIILYFTGMVSGQTASDGTMPQYLYKDFGKSVILMKGGQIQSALMNYNTITGMMVFEKDDKYYDLINQQLIDTVYLQETRFIPVGKVFYEVLVTGPVVCFIQHNGNLMAPGKQVGYGGTSQVASTDYITNINLSGGQYNLEIPSDFIVRQSAVYWIRKGTEMQSFLNEKQMLKLFPGKADQIKSFIKENHLKIEKPEDLAMIIRFAGSLQ